MTKAFWKSKTFYGLLITIAGTLGLGDYIPAGTESTIADTVNGVLQLVGIVVAAYGRIKADKPLGVVDAK